MEHSFRCYSLRNSFFLKFTHDYSWNFLATLCNIRLLLVALFTRHKIHSLRAGKNIIYRTVASFFPLKRLKNLKIKEYVFSRSPLNCCIRFVWKSNENSQYTCEIHPHQATKFTLVSDFWVLRSPYVKVIIFLMKILKHILYERDSLMYGWHN